MKLYRIENKDGKGICRATGSAACALYCAKDHNECEHCSLLTLKNRDYWMRHKRAGERILRKGAFAFPSIRALEIWFPSPDGRRAMQDAGFNIVQYAPANDTALVTDYQAVFDKTAAKKLGTLDLVTFQPV